MLVKFLKDVRDKYTDEIYLKDSTKEVSNKRGTEMCLSPFVVEIKENTPEKDADKPKRATRAKKAPKETK